MCKVKNCVVGIIGNEVVRHTEWEHKEQIFKRKIIAFHTARNQVPYPGFCIRFNFCPECGKKLDN